MSKKEAITGQLDELREDDLDRVLALVGALKRESAESRAILFAAESALAKDWLTAEEDAAWADL